MWIVKFLTFYFLLEMLLIFSGGTMSFFAESKKLTFYKKSGQIKSNNSSILEDREKKSEISVDFYNKETSNLSYKKNASIVVLNKITGKAELVNFELDKSILFGKISIKVQKCIKVSNPLRPTNLMFIKVFNNNIRLIFDGWIDSSNLSLSNLEHPVYEIIPIKCID